MLPGMAGIFECQLFSILLTRKLRKYLKELEKRESCDFILYVITPLMEGAYSIAEVVDDSNKRPEKTIFCVLDKDGDSDKSWSEHQMKSFRSIENMVEYNGALVLDDLNEVKEVLNYYNSKKD